MASKPFPYQLMEDKMDALDRLELRFRWGAYGFRVLRCHLASFPPGKIIRYHKHSEFEFHFIPRGSGVLRMEDKEFDLREGMFYLTGPGVLHEQQADNIDPMYELCLHVDIMPLAEQPSEDGWGEQWEQQEAEHCVQALQHFPLQTFLDQHQAMPWFLHAYRAWVEGRPGFYSSIKQAIIQIMMRAARVTGPAEAPFALPSRNLNKHRFQLAVQYIQDNYSSAITLQEVAERLHISVRQLQRIFQEQHDCSFSIYLENYRLTRVCAALIEDLHPIEQIALDHGFSGSNYLYYVFKKKIGMTPKQYKQQHHTGAPRLHQPSEVALAGTKKGESL
ncbi:helix-turn-helix transcriptional regulator [Paenibacillus daejeonensis]|uniref:helix-turn-helix transcriptional regulator n=1 Tax=Paenibacillus daejeonensis TaxID=135193 RepID=UPI00037E4241|nr:AraC family transcriptional regulator [Paenibacillus daejeonensis]